MITEIWAANTEIWAANAWLQRYELQMLQMHDYRDMSCKCMITEIWAANAWLQRYELHHEKTCLCGLFLTWSNTNGLYNHRRWLEAWNFGLQYWSAARSPCSWSTPLFSNTVKPVLSGHFEKIKNEGLKDRWSLNTGLKYCRMLQGGAFCNTFDLY